MEAIIKILKRGNIGFDIVEFDMTALQVAAKVDPSWMDLTLDGVEMPSDKPLYVAQMRIAIARYLLERRLLPAAQRTVTAAWKAIVEKRKEVRDVPLLKGREVVFLAASELYFDGTRRFGPPGEIEKAISADQDGEGSASVYRVEKGKETTAKDAYLDKILNAKGKLTMMFHGHGGNTAIYLAGSIRIGYRELATVLSKRMEKHPDPKDTILILNCCNGTKFVQNVISQMTQPEPIMIANSGVGQSSYTDSGKTHSEYFDRIFKKTKTGEAATIGTIFKNEFVGRSNPTMHIADGKDHAIQITSMQPDSGMDSMA